MNSENASTRFIVPTCVLRAECRKDDETAIDEEWVIVSPETLTPGAAALDLQNYLQVSMGLSLPVRRESGRKTVVLEPLEEKGFFWNVEAERIVIRGNVRRGVHWLEDLMNLREAPYLKRGNGRREPLFSPRMVHSGWGLDQFPDRHLDAIAHAGFDTILLFVRGVDLTDARHPGFQRPDPACRKLRAQCLFLQLSRQLQAP